MQGMDVTDCIRRMVGSSGRSARQLSRDMGRAPTWLATVVSRGTDTGASRLAMIARACGWRLVLRSDADEMEVSEHADGNQGTTDKR